MTENEAIDFLEDEINGLKEQRDGVLGDVAAEVFWEINGEGRIAKLRTIIGFIEKLKRYREIGTVEECKKAVKEEDTPKFYYCESEDDYYIGKRVGNFYYARYAETEFEWFMSRYLPWGEHVVEPNTLWKEYTYPSEPKEIPFFEWLHGFVKKYCGGTVEECREAVEKQRPVSRITIEGKLFCPKCKNLMPYPGYCGCGQRVD